VTTRWI